MLKHKIIGGISVAALMLGTLAVPSFSSGAGTTKIVALDGTFTGFNNFTSAQNSFYLAQVENQLWPSPYIMNQAAKFVLDTDIVTKAVSADVKGQQVVTYTINPQAVWSDGVPLTADDFIYMYQASSGATNPDGSPKYTDIDGNQYDVAGNAGYNQIQSVVGSKPASGACAPGTAANRNVGLCPNGKTVTVTFMKGQSYAEWPGLFGLLPAHVARVVGWNTGMDDPSRATADILSAGPYVLSSVDMANNTYIETKNPRWWGTPAKTDTLVFTNLADDTQGIAGLAAGDFNVFQPTTVSASMISQAKSQSGVTSSVIPGYVFEHLDFNFKNPNLAKLKVREAIALAVNRKAIIAATVGQVNTATKPLDNYIFMSNQAGYKADGAAYDNAGSTADLTKAKALLASSGYVFDKSDSKFHVGSASGTPLTFQLWEKGSSVRAAEAQIVQADLAKIGITVDINVASNSVILGTDNFDMVIFGWAGSPLLSGYLNIYGCTTTAGVCTPNSSNYGNLADAAVSKVMAKANTSLTIADEVKGYQQADQMLWKDLPTLPFYQSSQGAFWSGVSGVVNNPTQAGITWNAQEWQ